MKTKLLILSAMISASLCGCESKTENISEDEINALIQGRQKIMTVTEYDCLPFDSNSKVSIDGTDYYAVNDESYDDWNEWTDYVESIYCDEAAEAILGGGKIIEFGGKTYTNDGGKGNDLSEKYTFDIISETDSTAVITLKNTDNFTSETVETEISLKKTSSGWRISDIGETPNLPETAISKSSAEITETETETETKTETEPAPTTTEASEPQAAQTAEQSNASETQPIAENPYLDEIAELKSDGLSICAPSDSYEWATNNISNTGDDIKLYSLLLDDFEVNPEHYEIFGQAYFQNGYLHILITDMDKSNIFTDIVGTESIIISECKFSYTYLNEIVSCLSSLDLNSLGLLKENQYVSYAIIPTENYVQIEAQNEEMKAYISEKLNERGYDEEAYMINAKENLDIVTPV